MSDSKKGRSKEFYTAIFQGKMGTINVKKLEGAVNALEAIGQDPKQVPFKNFLGLKGVWTPWDVDANLGDGEKSAGAVLTILQKA